MASQFLAGNTPDKVEAVCQAEEIVKLQEQVKGVLVLTDPRFNHQVKVQKGLLQAECAQILSDFFANLRKK